MKPLTEELRGLCPRVVTPKCEPGDGICIPCRAADALDSLREHIAASDRKIERVLTIDFAEELAHHAWDAVYFESETFAGVSGTRYFMDYAQAGAEIQATLRAALLEPSETHKDGETND